MRVSLAAAIVMPLAALAPAISQRATPADYSKLLERARKAGTTYPRASLFQLVQTDDKAYALQATVVAERLRHDRLAGFKGGAMHLSAAGAAAPIFGVLFRFGRVAPPIELRLSRFCRLVIETGIGFEIGRRIDAPIADAASLRRYVRAIRPAIELPDSAIGDMPKVTNRDLVAANVIAASFAVGAPVHPGAADPNAVGVRLYRDGVLVNEGRGTENLGDQWAALHWIVNQVVARRGSIEPGALIITGALGTPLPASTGSYRANFDGLGQIAFRVLP